MYNMADGQREICRKCGKIDTQERRGGHSSARTIGVG